MEFKFFTLIPSVLPSNLRLNFTFIIKVIWYRINESVIGIGHLCVTEMCQNWVKGIIDRAL